MARETFISYKYSEIKARDLRDRIIDALGKEAAKYYRGETCKSPDLGDKKSETIKKNLKDMIFGTSVTIVIISPKMTESKWIDWEIEYSLSNYSRDGKTSKSNGIVGVVMKVDGGYRWIQTMTLHRDNCTSINYDPSKLYPIITNNRFNETPTVYKCARCKTVDELTGNYISLIEEERFLNNPSAYIENAHNKSQHVEKYNLSKDR